MSGTTDERRERLLSSLRDVEAKCVSGTVSAEYALDYTQEVKQRLAELDACSMTAPAHTPKPWTRHEVQHRIVASRAGHRVTVAWMSDSHDDAIPAEERDANERLIAAAPELLEALEKVTKAWLYEASQGDGIMEEHTDVLDAASTAIAAARGES